MAKFEVGNRVKGSDYEGVVIGFHAEGRLVRIIRDDGVEGFNGTWWQTSSDNLTLIYHGEFTLENE